MWRLTATLLVLGLASASPQNYNHYAPRRPINPVCPVITSHFYDTRVLTSHNIQTVNRANTQFVTTTVFRQQVVPTTVFQTRVQTQIQDQTSFVTVTSTDFRDQVVTSTVQNPGFQQTRIVTSTRIVNQVSFITSTQFQTQGVPVEVTRTRLQTINQPFTNVFTQTQFDTRVVTVPGRDVVQTRVQTVVQTSLVRQNQQGNTRFITTTLVQQQIQTVVVPGQNVFSTRVVQRQQVVPFTSFNTRFETAFATSQLVITRTNVLTQTQFQTQVTPQEVTETRVVPNTVVSTIFRTQFRTLTRVQTVVRTRFVTQGPVFETHRQTRTSVLRVPGPNRIATQQVVQTRLRQQIVYRTVSKPKKVVVTQTVAGACVDAAAYDYDYPGVGVTPFDEYYK